MRRCHTIVVGLSVVSLAAVLCGCATPPDYQLSWSKRFDNRLQTMGKNNWIVITEAGFPNRHLGEDEMIATRKSLPSVLSTVLSDIEGSVHAGATAWLSEELERIPDRDLPGVAGLNRKVRVLLADYKVKTTVAPEQEILKKLNEETATYYVLFLKTTTPVPYSTVYLQLDRQYWDEAREKRLREALKGAE